MLPARDAVMDARGEQPLIRRLPVAEGADEKPQQPEEAPPHQEEHQEQLDAGTAEVLESKPARKQRDRSTAPR